MPRHRRSHIRVRKRELTADETASPTIYTGGLGNNQFLSEHHTKSSGVISLRRKEESKKKTGDFTNLSYRDDKLLGILAFSPKVYQAVGTREETKGRKKERYKQMVKICWDQWKWAGLSLFHESPGAGANWPGRGRTRVSNVCSCPFPLSILARIVPAVMMTSGVGILRAKSRKPQNLTLGNWGKTQGGDLLLVFLKDQGLNRSRMDAALKFCFPKTAEWWRNSWLRSALVGDSGDWMSPCFWILHLGGLRPLQGEFLKSNEDSRVAFSPPKSDLTAHSHSGTGQDSSKTSYFF